MTTTSALTDLLALSIKAETTRSPKTRQVAKRQANKTVAEMYPSYLVKRVNFLKARKRYNKMKESVIGIKLSK